MNSLLKEVDDDNIRDIEFNERIEAIDQYIDADKEVLNIIKNSILIEEVDSINNDDIIKNIDLKIVGNVILIETTSENLLLNYLYIVKIY